MNQLMFDFVIVIFTIAIVLVTTAFIQSQFVEQDMIECLRLYFSNFIYVYVLCFVFYLLRIFTNNYIQMEMSQFVFLCTIVMFIASTGENAIITIHDSARLVACYIIGLTTGLIVEGIMYLLMCIMSFFKSLI